MCGICGILDLGRRPIDRRVLEAMNHAIVHRGPDSSGMHTETGVGLAMRRLSIIDLAGGDQPIPNEDGTIHVVQNGEIYNYRELRTRLEGLGHRFRTESDTEVLVHGYEEWGTGFARELRGMFAVAIWDAPRRRLVLARDRFGIKPLYYRHAAGRLSFGSELKALLADPELPRTIDPDALEAYLAFNWIPAPLTIFRGVSKLRAGHMLVSEDGSVGTERYARVGAEPSAPTSLLSEEQMAQRLRSALRESVRAHLVADVPVGVLLSGGVDSAALTALAAEESGERIKTFTIGFEEREFSELELARQVAERYDTDHHELVVRPNAAELLPKLAQTFDEPFADSSALPTYLVSELAAREVKVAFSGEGGDELFAGYRTYAADMLAPRLGRPAAMAQPFLERIPSGRTRRLEDRIKRFARAASLPPLERHHGWTEVFAPEVREALVGPEHRGRDPLWTWHERYVESVGADPLARFQDVDLGIAMVDDQLTKTDRASMAHSLETRVPLLDPGIAELAFSLPRSYKLRGLAKKRILRKAAAPLVPDDIINGRKRGFSIPAARWLRGELKPLAQDLLSPERVRSDGFFDPAMVTSLFKLHLSGQEDLSRQLWGLLTFTLWYEEHVTSHRAVRR